VNTKLLLDTLDVDGRGLLDMPVDALLEAQGQVLQETWESGMAFQPVVDGTVLPQRSIDALAGGASADVAVLAGTNLDEMRLFTWPTPAFGGALKACHALEIPFVFNALDAPGASFFTGDASPEMRGLAATMHEAWASFARTGVPKASGLPDWPAYTAGESGRA